MASNQVLRIGRVGRQLDPLGHPVEGLSHDALAARGVFGRPAG